MADNSSVDSSPMRSRTGGQDLDPLDGVDAEVGLERHVEVEDLGRVPGAVGDDRQQVLLDADLLPTGPARSAGLGPAAARSVGAASTSGGAADGGWRAGGGMAGRGGTTIGTAGGALVPSRPARVVSASRR
jgi:hypothetical protein